MLHDIAGLIKAIAWPGVVLTALILLLPQLRDAGTAIAEKIRTATRVKIGGNSGIELAVEIARGRTRTTRPDHSVEDDVLHKRFDELSIQYDEMPNKSAEQHVDRRMNIADEIGKIAVTLKMDRSGLAESSSEAKLVSFATAAVYDPMANDLKNLCVASATAKFRFTRYRIVLALLPTLARRDVSKRVLANCNTVLDNVEHQENSAPDISLQNIINKTRVVVEETRASLS